MDWLFRFRAAEYPSSGSGHRADLPWGGLILDGENHPPFYADLGILGGRIRRGRGAGHPAGPRAEEMLNAATDIARASVMLQVLRLYVPCFVRLCQFIQMPWYLLQKPIR